jgi:hypothetical protein
LNSTNSEQDQGLLLFQYFAEFQWSSNQKIKAKAHQERKIRKRRKSQFKKNSIKMKWASAKDKLKLKNFVIPNNLKINVQNSDETNDQG